MGEKVHNALIGRLQDVGDAKDVERQMSILAQMGRDSDQELAPLSKLQLAGVCAQARMYDVAMPMFESAVSKTLLVWVVLLSCCGWCTDCDMIFQVDMPFPNVCCCANKPWPLERTHGLVYVSRLFRQCTALRAR